MPSLTVHEAPDEGRPRTLLHCTSESSAKKAPLTVHEALDEWRPCQVAAPHDAHQHQQVGAHPKHQGGDEGAHHLRKGDRGTQPSRPGMWAGQER